MKNIKQPKIFIVFVFVLLIIINLNYYSTSMKHDISNEIFLEEKKENSIPVQINEKIEPIEQKETVSKVNKENKDIDKNEHKMNKKENITEFYEDNLLNTANFNYKGECKKIFKYEPNNKRDLIFYSMYYKNEKNINDIKKMLFLLNQ